MKKILNKLSSIKNRNFIMILLIIIFLFPVIINGMYVEWGIIKFKWNPEHMLSYYSNICSAILSGLITFIALKLTFIQNDKIELTKKHDNIRPVLNTWHITGADINNITQKYECIYSPEDNEKLQVKVGFKSVIDRKFNRDIRFKNIGFGPAYNIKIILEKQNNFISLNRIFHLGINEILDISFIASGLFLKEDKYKLIIIYDDILEKKYIQDINFEIIADPQDESGFNLNTYLVANLPQTITDDQKAKYNFL